MNIAWALVVILASVSIIIGASTAIGVKYDEFNLFGIPVYAQSSNNNATSLPPAESESVEPNSTATSEENSTGYLKYDDSDTGFKIDYPSDWESSEKLSNNAIAAFSPPPDYGVEVDVKVYPRTNSMSLKTFGDINLKKSDSFKISAYYRNSTTLLGGQPAIRAVGTLITTPNLLTGDESTTKKILRMTTLLKEKKSFLEVIYYADKSNFMDYLPLVEHMIKSFQFQNAKPVIQEED